MSSHHPKSVGEGLGLRTAETILGEDGPIQARVSSGFNDRDLRRYSDATLDGPTLGKVEGAECESREVEAARRFHIPPTP